MIELWFYKSFTIKADGIEKSHFFAADPGEKTDNILLYELYISVSSLSSVVTLPIYETIKVDKTGKLYKWLLNLISLLYLFCYEQNKMVFPSNFHFYFINRGAGHFSLFVYILVC